MHLVSLIALTMLAFAANSVLTRMAIEGGHIDPAGFALVRVAAGAVVLAALVWLRAGGAGAPILKGARLTGAISLAVYMIGFSLAYLTLDAGLGALILFGVVQITMFVHSAATGAPPVLRQITGAALAFIGLLLALWPGEGGIADPVGAAMMGVAGLGWATYTIVGRGAIDPLAVTAANFILCLPMVVILLIGAGPGFSAAGLALGILCGGITSGLGYALWYRVLPHLDGATAAVVQLSVPVIALVAGVLLLGETVSLLLILATACVVGGIGWAVTAQSVPTGRK